jgi:hypothetical protein
VHANQPRVIPNIAVCGSNVDASWRGRNRDSKTAAALDQRFDGVITTETDFRRVDTFQNLQNPGVRLILFVPGQRYTLRVAVCRTTACVKML